MVGRLPPLNALKAFEATARLLSVKKAAAELSVTPAAVSHQIKALEDHLGVKLFHRHNRALELTEAARARMASPTPRVALGQSLRGIASAAADISDGLVGDLGEEEFRGLCPGEVTHLSLP